MPREFINGRKAFTEGYVDAGDGRRQQFLSTARATYRSYYNAGQEAKMGGLPLDVGYLAAVETIGVRREPITTGELRMAMSNARQNQPEPARTTTSDDRRIVDFDTCIIRARNSNRIFDDPMIEVIPTPQASADRDHQAARAVTIYGIEHIEALRDACEWLLAQEVERRMTQEAVTNAPDDMRGEQAPVTQGGYPRSKHA